MRCPACPTWIGPHVSLCHYIIIQLYLENKRNQQRVVCGCQDPRRAHMSARLSNITHHIARVQCPVRSDPIGHHFLSSSLHSFIQFRLCMHFESHDCRSSVSLSLCGASVCARARLSSFRLLLLCSSKTSTGKQSMNQAQIWIFWLISVCL